MSNKHLKTLAAVFQDPVSGTIPWRDVESMLVAAGGLVIEGSGSRIRIDMNGWSFNTHRPHPAKETKKFVIRELRAFLRDTGVWA